jgi:GTPase SAR1 family protein
MRRGRFFILGEGRVGKSTILRALMGEDFDPALESTEVGDSVAVHQ